MYDPDIPERAEPDLHLSLDRTLAPIYYATHVGLEAVAKLLIEAGTDPSTQGGKYGNSLQATAVEGRGQLVKWLLEAGADVNACFNKGSALSTATLHRDKSMMETLLAAGADIKAASKDLKSLDTKIPSLKPGNFLTQTAQCYAATTGNEAMVQELLKTGVDLNNSLELDSSPSLHLVAGSGRIEVVRTLLAAGANPAKKDHVGRTVHDYAEKARSQKVKEVENEVARFSPVLRLHTYLTLVGGKTKRKHVEISRRTNDHVSFSDILEIYKSTQSGKMGEIFLERVSECYFCQGKSDFLTQSFDKSSYVST